MSTHGLNFFRQHPDRLLDRAPLLSSLQSFETALVLLSMYRYPHVLTTCAQAIESALRSAFGIADDDDDYEGNRFAALLSRARRENKALRQQFSYDELKDFREARNRFIHRGFSPNDDEEAGRLLLQTGFPFLAAVYKELLKFDFYTALRADVPLSDQLQLAISVFHDIPKNAKYLKAIGFPETRRSLACFTVFEKLIEWIISPNNEWEGIVLEKADEIGMKYEAIENLRRQVNRQFDNPWSFSCPACSEFNTLECDLELPEEGSLPPIIIKKGICLACHLCLPQGLFLLNNAVCEDQISQEAEKIRHEYSFA